MSTMVTTTEVVVPPSETTSSVARMLVMMRARSRMYTPAMKATNHQNSLRLARPLKVAYFLKQVVTDSVKLMKGPLLYRGTPSP